MLNFEKFVKEQELVHNKFVEENIHKFKKGDKIICRKTLGDYYKRIEKGKIYLVEDVVNDYLKFLIKVEGIYFSLVSNNNFLNINDYFYTMKEARRLKLKKLNSPLTKIVNLFKQR